MSPKRSLAAAAVITSTVLLLASCAVGTGGTGDGDADYDRDADLSGQLSVMGFSGVDEVATSRMALAESELGDDVDVSLIEGELDQQQFLSASVRSSRAWRRPG